MTEQQVAIDAGGVRLVGDLAVPPAARGLIVFAHGTGSSRLSPRNAFVATRMRDVGGFGTLLFDLLTEEEDEYYENRFDIGLLTGRLIEATTWAAKESRTSGLPVGYFGASTGAAAALIAAAELGDRIGAVVSRGGRPDLAADALRRVSAPTLLIVGGADPTVIQLNREAYAQLVGPKELVVIPGATHLFEEPGALEQVAQAAGEWFEEYLGKT
jgi:pimeloyl-ACP methyl ester carboxylesterase